MIKLNYSRDNLLPFFSLLERNRVRNIATILACGRSAGIGAEQSKVLQTHTDVWALNQAFLHPHLVPTFYHLEFKSVGPYSNLNIWERFFDLQKRKLYARTVFMSPQYEMLLDVLKKGPTPRAAIRLSMPRDRRTAQGCYTGCMTNRSMHLRYYCSASITGVVSILYRMAYANIAFLGVDLDHPSHFYSDYPGMVQFDKSVINKSVATTGPTIHATAARGVHIFLDHVARAYPCKQLHTLSQTGLLLTNATNIRRLTYQRVILLAMRRPAAHGVYCVYSGY